MTDKEIQLLFSIVDGELRTLVNEYDPDTGRRPSKKRLQTLPALEVIRDRIVEGQAGAILAGPNGIPLIVIERLQGKDMSFSAAERRLIGKLAGKYYADLEKAGMRREAEQAKRIAESCNTKK